MKKYITFIISAFNAEKYISKMLDSLLKQSDKNFSVIVCNDGSTDNTLDLLNKYKRLFLDSRIDYIVLNKENGGVSSSFNKNIEFVKTPYFISCDSDDWYDENVALSINNFCNQNSFELAFIGSKFYKEINGRLSEYKRVEYTELEAESKDWVYDFLHGKNTVCYTGTHVVNKEVFFNIYSHGQIREFGNGQNWQILLPLLSRFKPAIIHNAFYNYLLRSDSISHQMSFEKYMSREKNLLGVLESVILTISNERDIDKIKQLIDEKYFLLMNLTYRAKNRQSFENYYLICKQRKLLKGYLKFKSRIKKLIISFYH